MNSNNDSASHTPLRVLISGGGTGGHIFPALSIAEALLRKDPGTVIHFVGATGRMEMEKVPAAGFEITGLPVAGFDRKRLWRNFGVAVKLLRSMRKARRIVRDFKPDIAVGVGGYASGPALKAAQRCGIPTVIQEQNSYAGVTNKMLAAKADAICTAYNGMERFFPADRIFKTGNPVRESLTSCALTRREAKKAMGFDPDKPLLFVTGGSLGARSLNEATAAALDLLAANGIQLMWQTGKIYADEFSAIAAGRPGVKASAFVTDMSTAYRAANLVAARAGAGTISEIELLGKASVLVPSPNVAEDHQRKNAEALAGCDAAVMILDRDAKERLGATAVELMADPQRLDSLGRAAAGLASVASADAIADVIISKVKKK